MPKKKENILLLAPLPHGDNIDNATRKPEIILDYNQTKSRSIMLRGYIPKMKYRGIMVIFSIVLNVA